MRKIFPPNTIKTLYKREENLKEILSPSIKVDLEFTRLTLRPKKIGAVLLGIYTDMFKCTDGSNRRKFLEI